MLVCPSCREQHNTSKEKYTEEDVLRIYICSLFCYVLVTSRKKKRMINVVRKNNNLATSILEA